MIGRFLLCVALLTFASCERADDRLPLTDAAFATAREKCKLPNAHIAGIAGERRIVVPDYRHEDDEKFNCLSREMSNYSGVIGLIGTPSSSKGAR